MKFYLLISLLITSLCLAQEPILPPGGQAAPPNTAQGIEPAAVGSPLTVFDNADELVTTVQALDAAQLAVVNAIISGGTEEVLIAADFASLPVTGEESALYVTEDTNEIYHWDGAAYVLVGGSEQVAQVANFVALPVTGELGVIYITQDTGELYLWDGATYAQASGSEQVSQVADFASLPVTGETGVIYITQDTGEIHLWSGTDYVPINPRNLNAGIEQSFDQPQSAQLARNWRGAIEGGMPNSKKLIDNGFYNTFPSAVSLPSGRHVIGYRQAISHVTGPSSLQIVVSDDRGKTVSDPVFSWDLGASNDVRDIGMGLVTRNGQQQICVTLNAEVPDGARNYETRITFSSDEGNTWSSPVYHPILDNAIVNNIHETSSGTIILVGWKVSGDPASVFPTTSHFWRSTDGGDSFTQHDLVFAPSPVDGSLRNCDESDMIEVDGDLFAVCRRNLGSRGFLVAKSTDDGVTWAEVDSDFDASVWPATLTEFVVRPNIVSNDGKNFYMFYRSRHNTVRTGIGIMHSNDMVNWRSLAVSPRSVANGFMYGSWIEQDNEIGFYWGREIYVSNVLQRAEIHFSTLEEHLTDNPITKESARQDFMMNPSAQLKEGNYDSSIFNQPIRELRRTIEDFHMGQETASPFFFRNVVNTSFQPAVYSIGQSGNSHRMARLLETPAVNGQSTRMLAQGMGDPASQIGSKSFWLLPNNVNFDQTNVIWGVGWGRQFGTNDSGSFFIGIDNATGAAPTEFQMITYDDSTVKTTTGLGIPFFSLGDGESYGVLIEFLSGISNSLSIEDRVRVQIFLVDEFGRAIKRGEAKFPPPNLTNPRLRATVTTLDGTPKTLPITYTSLEISIN